MKGDLFVESAFSVGEWLFSIVESKKGLRNYSAFFYMALGHKKIPIFLTKKKRHNFVPFLYLL